ncbi:MAG: hypothetical protein WBE14_18435 [Xanthobacteraceae bacterium]
MLKIAMDETGVHENAEMVAVAGYISRPAIWRDWTKAWNATKKPIKIVHAVDCANFKNEFDGWDKDRRDAWVANLLPVIPAHELGGIIIGIHLKDFEAALKGHPWRENGKDLADAAMARQGTQHHCP